VRGDGWGDHSLLMTLPTGAIRFTDLSAQQANSLKITYARFITADTASAAADAVVCAAHKLAAAPQVDPECMAVEGLYTPLKQRRDDACEVTGVNFTASIPISSGHREANLGVAREDELTLANVIENFLRILSAHEALAQGGLVLHSAGLVFDQQAWIFVGRSGVGKTTLTGKAHNAGAIVLSDDVNLLLPEKDGYRAYAVPFTGEFGRTLDHADAEVSYPVAGVVLLEQGEQLAAQCVTRATATARLMVGSPFVNIDAAETDRLLDNLEGLAMHLPVASLQSRRDDTIEDIMNTVKRAVTHG
jgi:hypothetical protein